LTADTASLSEEKETGRCATLGSIVGTGVASGAVASSVIGFRGLPLSLLLSRLDNDELRLRAGSSALSLIMLCRNEFLRLTRAPLAVAAMPSLGLSGTTSFRGEGDREPGIHDRRRSLDERELEGVGSSESPSLTPLCDFSTGVLLSLFLFAVALVVASCGRLFRRTAELDNLVGSGAISRGAVGSESGEFVPEEVTEPLSGPVWPKRPSTEKGASGASKKVSFREGK
jgi:hypothetical protein